MKRMINITALITVLMAVGFLNVSAGTLTLKANSIGKQTGMTHSHSQYDSAFTARRAKSPVGMDTMCLALDLRDVEMVIAEASIFPEYEEVAWESIGALLYHLDGTAEGEMLNNLLTNEAATMADYFRTIVEIETSLKQRLKGEARWAFNVGLVLSDVFFESEYGDAESFRNAVKDLQALVEDAEGYASEEEIELLNSIVASAEKEVWTDEDYVAFDENIGAFLGLYFETA